SSTTATMRSIGCNCCAARGPAHRNSNANARKAKRGSRLIGGSWARSSVGGGGEVVHPARHVRRDQVKVVAVIAENTTAQDVPCVAAGRAQALEFELQHERVVQVAVAVAHV